MSKYTELEALIGLEPAHSLVVTSRERMKRDGTMYETRWLNEHDTSNKLVARYRTWSNQSLNPPYRKQLGWERYSLSGELLDREVRYSKREDNEYVH